jgi:hypothetical protein
MSVCDDRHDYTDDYDYTGESCKFKNFVASVESELGSLKAKLMAAEFKLDEALKKIAELEATLLAPLNVAASTATVFGGQVQTQQPAGPNGVNQRDNAQQSRKKRARVPQFKFTCIQCSQQHSRLDKHFLSLTHIMGTRQCWVKEAKKGVIYKQSCNCLIGKTQLIKIRATMISTSHDSDGSSSKTVTSEDFVFAVCQNKDCGLLRSSEEFPPSNVLIKLNTFQGIIKLSSSQ